MDTTTALALLPEYRTIADVRQGIQLLQLLMRGDGDHAPVLQPGIHYGKLTDRDDEKPSLWKPGAEKICVLFRINPEIASVEDLARDQDQERGIHEERRYRVKMRAIHQPTGVVLAEGIGEASSNEEKYAWKRTYSNAEWEATPEWKRRLKFYPDNEDGVRQIRMNVADVANTVLKIAAKRAFIDMVLKATAASDFFTQDLEDEDLAALIGETRGGAAVGGGAARTVRQPAERSAGSSGGTRAPRKERQQQQAASGGGTPTSGTLDFHAKVADVTSTTKDGRNGRPYTLIKIVLGEGVGKGTTVKTFDKGILGLANTAKARDAYLTGTALFGKYGADIQGEVAITDDAPGGSGAAEPADDAAGDAGGDDGAGEGGELPGI